MSPLSEITATFTGAAAYGAGGKQPITGPYKFRIGDVEDGSVNEAGEKSHKLTLLVVDAPKDNSQVGKSMVHFLTPPQGKAGEKEVHREGYAKQFLVGVGIDPKKVDALKGDRSWGARFYYEVDADGKPDLTKPREGYCFYEAFAGDGTRSQVTFLSPAAYKDVVEGRMQIALVNKPAAPGGGGGVPPRSAGGARTEIDPLGLPAVAGSPAGGAGSADAGAKAAKAVDDLLGS